MASDTHQRLIDAALKRFKREGFRNVGVEQIFGDVGISRTAFYKHFESKDDLMIEALEVLTRQVQLIFRDSVRERGGRSAVGQIRALFDVVEWIIDSDDFHGCTFVNAAIEFPLPHDPAHLAAANNRAEMVRFIEELAERAAGAADPTEMAEELALLMEGVYVARQITGRRNAVALARRLAEDVIRRHIGDIEITDLPAEIGRAAEAVPA